MEVSKCVICEKAIDLEVKETYQYSGDEELHCEDCWREAESFAVENN